MSWIPWVRVERASELLVWVYEYDVWESLVDWNLYYRWRRSAGDTNLLCDLPGHLFLPHEAHDAASLLNMSFLFGWGVRVANPTWQRAIQVDHDRKGVAIARSESDFSTAPREFTLAI